MNKNALVPFDGPVDELRGRVEELGNVFGWKVSHVNDLVLEVVGERWLETTHALDNGSDAVAAQQVVVLRACQVTDVQTRNNFKQH